MIPLTYVSPVKVQVAQLVEGINGFNGLSTLLKNVAVVSRGVGTITYATSKD